MGHGTVRFHSGQTFVIISFAMNEKNVLMEKMSRDVHPHSPQKYVGSMAQAGFNGRFWIN